MEVEFFHDVLAVFFDGFDADAESGGDLFVGQALGDELEDFGFAFGELAPAGGAGGASRGRLFEVVVEPAGDGGAVEGAAAGDLADGAREGFGRGLFFEETEHAGFAEAFDIGVVAVGGKDEDARHGVGGENLAGGFEAVEDGHGDVHENHIGPEGAGHLDGFAAGACAADQGKMTVGFEQGGEALAHDDVIFGQQNGNKGGHFGAVRALKTEKLRGVRGELFIKRADRLNSDGVKPYPFHRETAYSS